MGYESVVNRWNFVKGLDGIHNEKELLASFSKYRRKNIRIAQDSGLRVRPTGTRRTEHFRQAVRYERRTSRLQEP